MVDYRRPDSEHKFLPNVIWFLGKHEDLGNGYFRIHIGYNLLKSNWWYPPKTTFEITLQVAYRQLDSETYIRPAKEVGPAMHDEQGEVEGIFPTNRTFAYALPTYDKEGVACFKSRYVWARWAFSSRQAFVPALHLFPIRRDVDLINMVTILTMVATRMPRSGRIDSVDCPTPPIRRKDKLAEAREAGFVVIDY